MRVIEPLGRADVDILRLESRSVAGHTLKIAILGPSGDLARPDVDAVRRHVAERLPRTPLLRCRLREGRRGRATAWVDDPSFDVRRHVRPLPASEPVSERGLRDVVARVMEERLDRAHPLWTLDVLDAMAGGDVCLIWKLHHALADGVTALRLADAVLWDAPTGAGPGPPLSRRRRRLGRLGDALWVRRPERLPPVLRRELHRSPEPSPFDGSIGRARSVAFASVPLRAVRRAAKALVATATVNDVVLALVAGALRRSSGGAAVAGMRVRVPVRLDTRREHPAPANRGSFFVVGLPVDEPDTVQRLRRICAETARCKRGADPYILDTLASDLSRLAPPLRRAIQRLEGHPRTFALDVSNIAGPAERPTVLGAPVRTLYTVGEIGERHALRVAVVSMADELSFGLCSDPAIVPGLDPLADGLRAEASALLDLHR
jgi:WS/DGAT/MGAT family acyltransferase